jgi:hypothetical protein
VSIAIERRRIALDNRRIDQTRTTMSRTLEVVLNANAAYAADFDKGDLPMPPGRHFAILTGMDARLDPAKYAGLAEGSYVDWLTIKDHAPSVVEDVQRIRRHPLVPGEIPIYGSIYVDVLMRQLNPDGDERAGKASRHHAAALASTCFSACTNSFASSIENTPVTPWSSKSVNGLS